MENNYVDNLNIGDVVSITSKKFNKTDGDTKWFVIDKNNDYVELERDDSHLPKLYVGRGKHCILIPSEHWCDVIIKQK